MNAVMPPLSNKRTQSNIAVNDTYKTRTLIGTAIQRNESVEFIALPLVEDYLPASWTKVDGDILVSCPKCNKRVLIDPSIYKVRGDGLIYPSVLCPNVECDFDRYVLLQGYNGMGRFGRKRDNALGVIFYVMIWKKRVRGNDGKLEWQIQPCEYTHAVDVASARRTWEPLLQTERGEVIGIAPSIDPHVSGDGDPADSILAAR